MPRSRRWLANARLRRCAGVLVILAVSVSRVLAQSPAAARGTVHTERMWSQAHGVTKSVVVYLPPSYSAPTAAARRYPLAIYLHGVWGSETDWTIHGRLAETMDSLVAAGMPEFIVVMPDGDDGWWTTWHGLNDVAACRRTPRQENADTYCVPWPKYDDYVASDLIAFADARLRTLPYRASRAIAGLSMGGYGAMSIAARNPRVFAVAASHSGVLRPALFADSGAVATGGAVVWRDGRTREELRTAAGGLWTTLEPSFGADSIAWLSRDPAQLIATARRRGDSLPAMYVDIGVDDRFLTQDRSFRDRMSAMQAPLTYAEFSGRHDWAYWRQRLPESLRFIAQHLVP